MDVNKIQRQIAELKTNLKAAETQVEALQLKFSKNLFEAALKKNYFKEQGLSFAAFRTNTLSGKLLKTFAEQLLHANESLVLLVCSQVDGKSVFLVGCAKQAVGLGLSAAKLVKALAEMVQSKGGGRPELAMAGVKTSADLDMIETNFENVVRNSFEK